MVAFRGIGILPVFFGPPLTDNDRLEAYPTQFFTVAERLVHIDGFTRHH